MILPVTLTIAAAAALINLWLALRLSTMRVKGRVLIGDGGDPLLVARMRAHANFIEYAPLVVILIGLVELAGAGGPLLWALGAAFVLARIAHPLGMDRQTTNPWRAGGALVTWIVLALLAGWALAIAYEQGARPAPAATIELTEPRG